MERLKRNEQPTPSCDNDYDDPQPLAPGRGSSLQAPQRHRHCSSAGSSTSGNVMAGTRKDLLQGIRAMDDSIQNLKDEMNKLMSVYDDVKLKPGEQSEKAPLITEMGQSVLEVVGENSLIRFKDFGATPTQTAVDSVKSTETGENDYNTALGVYHENEISGRISIKLLFLTKSFKLGQKTTSPKPDRKSFKNKRHRQNAFWKYFKNVLG